MPNDSKSINTNDEQLIAAALHGDIESFGLIVERYWKMAFSLALTKINDPPTAEDIAQESFIKAYSQLHRLRNKSCFAGWLMKIVSQRCVDYIRKSTQTRTVTAYEPKVLETLNSGFVFGSNPGLNENQVNFVRQTIGRLPDKFKNVVVMRFMAGLTSAQIAKQLGKRHSTVRVWLHRAYQILKKELAPVFEEVK